MKKFVIVVFIVLILFAAFFIIARNTTIKFCVERSVESLTGLPLAIKSLNVGILESSLQIKDLVLFNPEGYPDRIMADIPEVYVDYDFFPLLKRKLHIKEARLYLQEFVIVKNKGGGSNLDSLKAIKEKKTLNEKEGQSQQKQPMKKMDFQIDLLKLKIDKVVFKDYSAGSRPNITEMAIHIDETFENITDSKQLVSLIVFKSMMHTGIDSIVNVDLLDLQNITEGTMKSTVGFARGAVRLTEGAVKKTSEGVKKIISLPFGNE